ncbi:MAG TPA: hypothetical protein VFS66_06290 [Acidimicrobiia bacterium]|nr:hypothetical protein [Acidimicrobiia bacterium]
MSLRKALAERSRPRMAQRVSAASYGTVLIIAALLVIKAEDVSSGWGWELVTGVGVATWVAHLFAEVLGNHVSSAAAHEGHEVREAAVDGLPILLAAVLPAVALGMGSLGVLDPRQSLWIAVIAALVQLVGLGAFVGAVLPAEESSTWRYAAITGAVGVGVVILLVALGH